MQVNKPVREFIEALRDQARLKQATGTALQSLKEQKLELAEVCTTVEFWMKYSDHSDPELQAAVKLMKAAQRLLDKALSKKSHLVME